MSQAPTPRRSVLFVPGSNARAIDKARGLPADVLIFDLEDAVTPAQKPAARQAIAAALATGGYEGRELALRVNARGTEWHADDLAFAAKLPLDAIVLPKVEDVATVVACARALAEHEAPPPRPSPASQGREPQESPPLRSGGGTEPRSGGRVGAALWCMIETPRGFLDVDQIAGASPRIAALMMGTADLTKDLRALDMPDRHPLLTALGLGLLAARAHGLAAIDGIHADLADDAGFEAQCRQGRALGFDGKTLIHPKTIAPANRIFAPAPEALDRARRMIAAHAAAEAAGSGVTLLDGKLVERLHVEEARRLVALAEIIARREHPADSPA